MENVTRRKALGAVAAGGALFTAPAVAAQGGKGEAYSFEAAEPAKSCRLLARTIDGARAQAQVVPGIINGTYFLVVAGKKPYANMRVFLSPLTYIRVPEYWGVEVVGCVSGIILPAVGMYTEHLPLEGIRGTRGVEVIWSRGETERMDMPARG